MNSFLRRGRALPPRMGDAIRETIPDLRQSGSGKTPSTVAASFTGDPPLAPTRRKEKTMGEYTRTVSCRMTEEDRQLLDQRAERLELANS